jgi:hypothetical protein
VATPHRLRHHAGVFRSVRAYMQEAIPGSRLQTIPRCSRLAQEDATAAAVVEHCKDFFGP